MSAKPISTGFWRALAEDLFKGTVRFFALVVARVQAFAVRRFGPNGDLKLLAAILATLLFLAIRPEAVGHKRTLSVPVFVEPVNNYSTVVDWTPRSVPVTFVGPQRDIEALSASHLRYTIRAANNPDDPKHPYLRLSYPVDSGTVSGQGSTRVRSIDAKEPVAVTFDYAAKIDVSKFVDLPAVEGLPGTAEATVSFADPPAVTAFGSLSRLNDLGRAGVRFATEPVRYEAGRTNFVQNVAIRLPPPSSGVEKVEPASLRVTVSIRFPEERAAPDDAAAVPTAIDRPGSPAPSEPGGLAGIFSSGEKSKDAQPLPVAGTRPVPPPPPADAGTPSPEPVPPPAPGPAAP